jgi:hypothetical protein
MNNANQEKGKHRKGTEMKPHTIRLSIMTVAIGSTLLMWGCNGDNGTGASTSVLAGTWARDFNGSTVTITLKANGSYTVNMDSDATADVRGRYAVTDDQVTFRDEGGNNASTLGEAVYRFVVDDEQLTLTPIDEPDENRRSVAAATWTKS